MNKGLLIHIDFEKEFNGSEHLINYMPFTPCHLGPGLLMVVIFLGLIDFPTILIASVIVDIEPNF